MNPSRGSGAARPAHRASVPRFLAGILLAVATTACEHKVGDECGVSYIYTPGPYCEGNELWVCSGDGLRSGKGTWTRTVCKGADGCREPGGARGETIACDISGNTPGDPCAYNYTWNNSLQACSASEPGILLECSGDHVVVRKACPAGCTRTNHHQARCDDPPMSGTP